jgi:wyosine [tRNA(Phe)-imidazoG37] synthetase (radical SAM superfamily)
MSTIIFPSPIFGPVQSRRLGVSLGINLLPDDGKICTFDCVYCECGFNDERRTRSHHPARERVAEELERQLIKMNEEGRLPDVLTFAGNGEPTSHPHFPEIIDDTIRLRNRYSPQSKISVLSNATFIGRPRIREALLKVDNNILKLDTVDNEYIRRVDRPTQPSYDVNKIIENMKLFNGRLIIQTMFLKGDGTDNTGDEYVLPWIEALKDIKPESAMIYTIDRETPNKNLLKATPEEFDRICAMVIAAGIPCTASY